MKITRFASIKNLLNCSILKKYSSKFDVPDETVFATQIKNRIARATLILR